MGQDRLLERPQLRSRHEPELGLERRARVPVRGERVGVPPGAVEREHLLRAQPLAQRMLRDQCVEFADELGMLAEREVGLDAILDGQRPQLLEPADLRLRPRLVPLVGEHRPSPQHKRLLQHGRRLARREIGAAPAGLFEPVGVELSRLDAQPVAAAGGLEPVRGGPERAAQP